MRAASLPIPSLSVGKYTVSVQAILHGTWRLVKEKPLRAFGGVLVLLLLLGALLAPWIAAHPYCY